MVSEKIEASLALQGKAWNGGLGITALSAAAHTLDHYREKVRANQTRLARSSSLDEMGDEVKNWPDGQRSDSAPGHARLYQQATSIVTERARAGTYPLGANHVI